MEERCKLVLTKILATFFSLFTHHKNIERKAMNIAVLSWYLKEQLQITIAVRKSRFCGSVDGVLPSLSTTSMVFHPRQASVAVAFGSGRDRVQSHSRVEPSVRFIKAQVANIHRINQYVVHSISSPALLSDSVAVGRQSVNQLN